MSFHTPHGSVRYRLPWSWAAFDYAELCRLLFEQCDARFEIATVSGRRGGRVLTDRGELSAPLVVDALGWRRVLAREGNQPPDAPLSRGLEVHPDGGGADLDVWIERSLVRHGYGWSVPAGGEQRVGVGSYEPRDHVREPTVDLAERLGPAAPSATRATGSPTGCAAAAEDGVFFVGDSAGHCFPLSGEGIRTALLLRHRVRARAARGAARRALARRGAARYAAFSASHARAYGLALRLQWLIPRLPPRLLTAGLRAFGRGRSWSARSAGTWTRRRRATRRRRPDRRSRPRQARSRARRATRCRSGACRRSAARGPRPWP